MKKNSYIINSPSFPSKVDFDKFPVWCEWEDSEEIPYLKFLCDSDDEFDEVIIKEYENGKETYYPIINLANLPPHRFLFIESEIKINEVSLLGYLSTSDNEVVSITLWLSNKGQDIEIDLYKFDRMVAEDENPINLEALSKILKIDEVAQVSYSSKFFDSDGSRIEGKFRLK